MGWAQEPSTIRGVWELVKGELKMENNTVHYPMSDQGRHMKIYTKEHYSTVWADPTEPSARFYPGFNGGTYTYTGGLLTEEQAYSRNQKNLEDQSFYKVSIQGDRLFMVPVTPDGAEKRYGFFEEWKRVE